MRSPSPELYSPRHISVGRRHPSHYPTPPLPQASIHHPDSLGALLLHLPPPHVGRCMPCRDNTNFQTSRPSRAGCYARLCAYFYFFYLLQGEDARGWLPHYLLQDFLVKRNTKHYSTKYQVHVDRHLKHNDVAGACEPSQSLPYC